MHVVKPVPFQEFQDLQTDLSLDDEHNQVTDDSSQELSPAINLGEDEMKEICQVHQELFLTLTRASWCVPPEQPEPSSDCLEPLIHTYQVAADVCKRHHGIIGKTIDL